MLSLYHKETSMSFPKNASTAEPVFFRSYSHKKDDGKRESWQEVTKRVVGYIQEIGNLSPEEAELIYLQQIECKSICSGRLNWTGGKDWLKKPENVYGAYNCNSTLINNIHAFGMMMNLAMQGVGTGAMLETDFIKYLPKIVNKLNVAIAQEIGAVPKSAREENTSVDIDGDRIDITVGDSRQGWVDSYIALLELATDTRLSQELNVNVYLGNVRPKGEKLQGFGGISNPEKLPEMYTKVAEHLNKAVGRQLTSTECCKLIDESALAIVAGNIRRSAGMRQASSEDREFACAKDNLWTITPEGKWKVDPAKDMLRMANHSRVFHYKPRMVEIMAACEKQYASGEGAIQYAPEAIARANADLLNTLEKKQTFIDFYLDSRYYAKAFLYSIAKNDHNYQPDDQELEHRLTRYALNPCGLR